jgi:hypothetical protein
VACWAVAGACRADPSSVANHATPTSTAIVINPDRVYFVISHLDSSALPK